MNEIRFIHSYEKLKNGNIAPFKSATLLEAIPINSQHLHNSFIDYDTAYFKDWNKYNYEIPEGKLILLIFRSGDNIWTTLRKFEKTKYEDYLSKRGQPFNIIIEEVQHERHKN